jgi:hypothetical protein
MKYSKNHNKKNDRDLSDVLKIVIEAFDHTTLVEDMLRIKKIFNDYFRNERNITDKERLSRMFKDYVYIFLNEDESVDYFMDFRDHRGNITVHKVIDDIIWTVNELEEIK